MAYSEKWRSLNSCMVQLEEKKQVQRNDSIFKNRRLIPITSFLLRGARVVRVCNMPSIWEVVGAADSGGARNGSNQGAPRHVVSACDVAHKDAFLRGGGRDLEGGNGQDSPVWIVETDDAAMFGV